MKNKNTYLITFLISIILLTLTTYYKEDLKQVINNHQNETYNISNIPDYNGRSYVTLNNNVPNFTEKDLKKDTFENYSDLDYLQRCGVAFAKVGRETMPTEKRGSIGMIKPSGWHTIKYDIVDGKYLYNRCHLIGYQLTGENANEKNLITCTRHMNTKGMLEFENAVAKYVKETNNHVLYRVTPIFENDNLLAKGVQIEAQSVEDNEISFNVFVYNVQENIEINYANGDSKLRA